MLAEAENREFALLSRENSDDFSGSPASPFESGGVSPLSSGSVTPTTPGQTSTEDILRGVNAVLGNTSGNKRRRHDDGSDDGAHESPKQSRNSRRAAERAAFRKSRRKADASKKDVLTERIADVRPAVADHYRTPRIIQAPHVVAALAIARSGYIGTNRPADTVPYDLANLVDERKFKHVRIDATKPSVLFSLCFALLHLLILCFSIVYRKAIVLVDKRGHVIANMIPGPRSDDWDDMVEEGAELCEEGRKKEKWSEDEEVHRRGHYPSISAAATHGNGRLVGLFELTNMPIC